MWWILTFVGWLFALLALVANLRIARARDTVFQSWAESEAKLRADRDTWYREAHRAGDELLAASARYNAARVELGKIAQIARQATAARAD